jgi:hypothetical protein
VKLAGREGNTQIVEGIDTLDGTPLLDIKPYTAKFDLRKTERNGWQDEVTRPRPRGVERGGMDREATGLPHRHGWALCDLKKKERPSADGSSG